MPKFKPGKSGNPSGREKGSTNKDISELRDRVGLLVEGLYEQVLEEMQELPIEKKIDALSKLLEYTLPKLQRTEITGPDGLPLGQQHFTGFEALRVSFQQQLDAPTTEAGGGNELPDGQ